MLALLAFLLVTWYNRRKRDDDIGDKFMDDDGDFDIRENVIFYDEEGAGKRYCVCVCVCVCGWVGGCMRECVRACE